MSKSTKVLCCTVWSRYFVVRTGWHVRPIYAVSLPPRAGVVRAAGAALRRRPAAAQRRRALRGRPGVRRLGVPGQHLAAHAPRGCAGGRGSKVHTVGLGLLDLHAVTGRFAHGPVRTHVHTLFFPVIFPPSSFLGSSRGVSCDTRRQTHSSFVCVCVCVFTLFSALLGACLITHDGTHTLLSCDFSLLLFLALLGACLITHTTVDTLFFRVFFLPFLGSSRDVSSYTRR